MPTEDDRRIKEIEDRFDERGYDLYLHEVEGHDWRAPYMPKGSRIGSADYGVGDTPREAAEDAQARYTRDNAVEVSATASMPLESTQEVRATASMPIDSTQGVSKKIGIAVETDTAMPITPSKSKTIGTAAETDTALPITSAKSRAIKPAVDLPELEEKVETLTTYGWRVLFEEEPDGKVTGYLLGLDSGEPLKSAIGDDLPGRMAWPWNRHDPAEPGASSPARAAPRRPPRIVGDKEDLAWCLVGLATVATRTGDPARGAVVLGAADALLEGMGALPKPFDRGLKDRTLAAIREQIDEPSLEAAWTHGRGLAVEQAVAAAVADLVQS